MNLPADIFPILAWHGPNRERFTPTAVRYLAEAGFNMAYVILTPGQVPAALDLAQAHGVGLVITVEGTTLWRRPGTVDEAWLARFRQIIETTRTHPACRGYMVADEPVAVMFPDVARACRFGRALAPGKIFYVNHWGVGQTYQGTPSWEESWQQLHTAAGLDLISADLYPFQRVTQQTPASVLGTPCHFPQQAAWLIPHYFEMLDLQRQLAARWQRPMWAFTLARGEIGGPATAEGEMRFQLMTALAYGARGLQYFSYEHEQMLMETDGTPAVNWAVAQRLNRLIQTWAPVLLGLRNIGVYHSPADLPYTRPLDQFFLGDAVDLFARGDPVVVGHFLDAQEMEHVLIVNRQPFASASSDFSFGTQSVEECGPDTGTWSPLSAMDGCRARLAFGPGGARLFRFRRVLRRPPTE